MLTRIPEVLSIDILSNWCGLKTVAKKDSAFCNKLDRGEFQCLLTDPTFGSTDFSHCHTKSFWGWIVEKEIKVMHIEGISCEEMSDHFVAELDCSKVIEIHVDQLDKVYDVARLINKSIHLKCFTVCDVRRGSTEAVNDLMCLISDRIWSDLTDLTIGEKFRKNRPKPLNLAKVSKSCTKLRRLLLVRDNTVIAQKILIQIIENNKQLEELTLPGGVCKTKMMTAIATNCVGLQSLTVADIHTNYCSMESVCAILKSCKQLTAFSFGDQPSYHLIVKRSGDLMSVLIIC